jgi:glycosyltransferase involved in cell wall biosynthesis
MRSMRSTVFLNGRFLSQPMTGVQRFSTEITAAIDRLIAEDGWPETIILTPGPAVSNGCKGAASYQHLLFRVVGKMRGHIWEQIELPRATRGGILVSLGNTAPLLCGRRQVVVIHDASVFDTPESYSLKFRIWYKALQRALAWRDVRIVTVSEFSRKRIATCLGIDPARINVIHEGADHILRVPPDMGTLERYALHRGMFALVVGSRVAHKNFESLHQAAVALKRRGMVMAVAGASDPNVYRNVLSSSLAAARELGRVSDEELRMLYENASCLLFPSRYEGFGLPPIEAMACGCPVIAARGGAVEEICDDGALYFDNGRGQTISATVELLLGESGLAEQMCIRGRARASVLTWDTSARALGRVIQCM